MNEKNLLQEQIEANIITTGFFIGSCPLSVYKRFKELANSPEFGDSYAMLLKYLLELEDESVQVEQLWNAVDNLQLQIDELKNVKADDPIQVASTFGGGRRK